MSGRTSDASSAEPRRHNSDDETRAPPSRDARAGAVANGAMVQLLKQTHRRSRHPAAPSVDPAEAQRRHLRQHPEELPEAERRMRASVGTTAAQAHVRAAFDAFMQQHERTALASALARHVATRRGARALPETARLAIRDAFAAARTEERARYRELGAALQELLRVTSPLAYVSADLLDDLTSQAMSVRNRSNRIGRDLGRDRAALHPPPELQQRLAWHQRQIARARDERQLIAALRDLERNRDLEAAYAVASDDDLRATTQARLDAAQSPREHFLTAHVPSSLAALLADTSLFNGEERWAIYLDALHILVAGGGTVPPEDVSGLVSGSRDFALMDASAVDVDSPRLHIDTYAGHGFGWDIHADERAIIRAPIPMTLDLTRSDPSGPYAGRSFAWRDSQVIDVARRHTSDADILAKLIYGFFGRAEARQGGLGPVIGSSISPPAGRDPDSRRVFAAMAESGSGGGPNAGAVEGSDRQQTLATQELLRRIWRETQEAEPGRDMNHVLRDGSHRFTLAVWSEIRRLYPLLGSPSVLSGLSVGILHHYQAADGTEMWVRVDYRHLRSVAPGLSVGTRFATPLEIGAVGHTGNATNAHIHMDLGAFEREADARQGRSSEVATRVSPQEFFQTSRPGQVRLWRERRPLGRH